MKGNWIFGVCELKQKLLTLFFCLSLIGFTLSMNTKAHCSPPKWSHSAVLLDWVSIHVDPDDTGFVSVSIDVNSKVNNVVRFSLSEENGRFFFFDILDSINFNKFQSNESYSPIARGSPSGYVDGISALFAPAKTDTYYFVLHNIIIPDHNVSKNIEVFAIWYWDELGDIPEYASLNASYSSLNSSYDDLQNDYNSLNSNYSSLETKLSNLKAELGSIRNLMYVFVSTTIIFIATAAYLAMRKPKVTSEA